AWNLRPYDLDLTPFVGLLTDGKAHSIRLGVLGTQLAPGDFWQLATNLLCSVAPGVAHTSGHLHPSTGPAPLFTQTITDPSTQGVPYLDNTTHSLMFVGDVTAAG